MSLQQDIEKETNPSKKLVGNFILNRLSIDKDAKNRWDRLHKCLDNCWNYILNTAKAEAKGATCYCAEDSAVFNWALEYILDIKTEEKPKTESQEVQSQSSPNSVQEPKEEIPVQEPEKPEKRKIYTKKPKKSDLDEGGEQLTLF